MSHSRRVQGVIGTFNENIYRLPWGLPRPRFSKQIFDVLNLGHEGPGTFFHSFSKAKEINGYKRVSLFSIDFRAPEPNHSQDLEVASPSCAEDPGRPVARVGESKTGAAFLTDVIM